MTEQKGWIRPNDNIDLETFFEICIELGYAVIEHIDNKASEDDLNRYSGPRMMTRDTLIALTLEFQADNDPSNGTHWDGDYWDAIETFKLKIIERMSKTRDGVLAFIPIEDNGFMTCNNCAADKNICKCEGGPDADNERNENS